MPLRRRVHASKPFVLLVSVLLAFVSRPAYAQQPPPPPAVESVAAPAPAGVIPSALSVEVTGSPAADGLFLDAQIRDALDRRIRPTLRPGASIRYGPVVPWPLLPLAPGQRAAVNVTVSVAGDDPSAAVTATTTVTLDNVAVAPTSPAVLFLSDDPEYFQSEGLVFHNTVAIERPARLYYYHSDVGVPRDLDVVLTASVPSRVQMIASSSGPDLDVMSVGHSVSRDFLRFQQANEGVVVDVEPGRPVVVRHTLMLQGEVVAGSLDLHVVSGGTVGVSVIGSPAGGRPDQFLNGPRVAYDGHRRHGVFDLASYGPIAGAFTVGGPPAAVQYGARTPTPRNLDPNDDGHDYGDYGVLHRITFALANPTDDPHRVYLYEKPLGGPVRSSFVVDGQLKEIGCVRVSQPYWIATYQLAPHSTGATTTLTMTDGGSFYPLEFGVTEAQPQPYTPPVGAPDGCSPNTPAFPTVGSR